MKAKFSPLTEDVLYCLRNGLLEDELGQAISQIWDNGVCDEKIANMFKKRVSKHQFQQAFYGIIPFKTPKLTKGDYVIGIDKNGRELLSFIQFLNANSLTVASAGAGKTNNSSHKILQIAPYVKGLFLFDLRKREFVKLKPLLAQQGIILTILTKQCLYLNPIQLPLQVTVSDWVPRISDVLVQVLELPPRASKLLQAKLFILYGKFDADKNINPTLYDLFEEIKKDTGSNHQARTAILDALKPVLLSLGPKVLAYRCGWPSHELAKKHLNFALGGCSETDKNLILNSTIVSEFTSRIAGGVSNPRMDLLIFVDESQRLCSSSNQYSAIADLIGLVRGTGIGLDLSLQSTHQLLPEVISNTATKILGRSGSMADYSSIGHSMGLSSEQIRWAQMNLKPGTFIAQMGEGPWRYPFIFKVPLIKCPKSLSDDFYDDNPLPHVKTVYANEFDKWGQVLEINLPVENESPFFDSEQEYSFCKAVTEHPMQASSLYPKLAGISSKSAKQVRKQLVVKNYIREHTLDSGGRGRSSILLEALTKGIKAVRGHEEKRCT